MEKRLDYWGAKDGETNSTAADKNKVEMVDNHIYFYSEVESPKMLELNKNNIPINKTISKNIDMYKIIFFGFSFTNNKMENKITNG